MAQVFRKAFRIVGLDARKCRRMVEQDFHRNFRTWICGFFSLHFFVLLFSFLHFLSRRIAYSFFNMRYISFLIIT